MCSVVAGQRKYEKEVRVNQSDVPHSAFVLVDSLHLESKPKWYKEYGIKKTSYEAKTKYKSNRYSIEFDDKGQLEDVEVLIKWNDIAIVTRKRIDDLLTSNHSKYSIDRLQAQYIGSNETIVSLFQMSRESLMTPTNYEIVIATKSDGVFTKFEYLFSFEGEFLKRSEIVLENTDHLDY